MNTLRYRLDLPANEPQGFTISNCDGTEYLQHALKRLETHRGALPLEGNASRPSIKMTVLECKITNGDYVTYKDADIADCLYGEPDTWIADVAPRVLRGEFPDWRLCAVDFSRYHTRLRFYSESTGSEDLYISKEAYVVLRFEVYRGEGLSPYIYTMYHSSVDDYGLITAELVEELDGKPTRLFEFGVEIRYTSDSDKGWRSNHPTRKEHIIVTEFR